MDNQENAASFPEQHSGVHKELKEQVSFATLEDAEDMFVIAKERLLDINRWHEVTTSLPVKFRITDRQGHSLNRHVHKGDYIFIDTPGPGNKAGEGHDWVFVEALTYDDYPDEHRESIALRLRPVSAPNSSGEEVAHFFDEDASSNFMIIRDRCDIAALYSGRNEKPNLDAGTLKDTVRNAVVAFGAILGFSDLQWKGLLKGFLKDED